MKKHWHALLLALGLGLLGYSCGSRGNSDDTDTTMSSEPIEAIDSTELMAEVAGDDDDGDPNIKAASVCEMKMVIDSKGNVAGRYVRTNQTSYTVTVQDDIEVPKLGHKVVVFSAKNGQGIVYTLRKNVNVRKEPTTESAIITQITYNDGEQPEAYPCLGKTKGWYKIRVKGAVGYVRHDLVEWDGMCTF